MNAAPQWMAAVRMALRAAPAGCEVRIDVADERTTVRLCDAAGDVAVCSIRRAAPAPKDARQVTLDEAIARRAAASPAPAAPAADTPPEPATASPATVADDRGEDWGEDGREYPDGPPYAELRIVRSDWQRYRRALGDVVGGAHQGGWMPDGDHRTLTVSRPQYDAIRGAREVPSAPAPCCAVPTCCGWEAFARAMSGVIAARLAMWERGGSAYKRERVAPVLALISTMLDTSTATAAAWDAEEDMRSAAYAWEEEHEQPEWWAVAGPAGALVRFVRQQIDPDSDPGDAEVTAEIIAARVEEIVAIVGSASCGRASEVSP